MTRSKWYLPALSFVLGLFVLAAQWIGGDLSGGLVSLGIMVAFSVFIVAAGGSETIRGLRGDGRDERFREIDVHATAMAGVVVIVAIVVAFLIEVADGHSGSPFTWLGALAGVSYVAAIIALRLRG